MNHRFLFLLVSALAASVTSAQTADPVLVKGKNVQILTSDLQLDIRRVPPEALSELLKKPEALRQGASNLYVRRALGDEALALGLDKDPIVQAALQQARDRVLSELRLAKIDQDNIPTEQAIETYARAAYKAQPERFRVEATTTASHILVSKGKNDAKNKAEMLLTQLKSGSDFAEMAKKESDDPGSASRGGELGAFGKGKMVPEFEQAVAKLSAVGELSSVIETQFGYHIIRLDGRQASFIKPYEDVANELKEEARVKLQSDARVREVGRLIEAAQFNDAELEAFVKSLRK